ncbi:ShlB/FhaC/HecB family hemolysin secretion/activation protein, partial [Histophilus somni]|uniref:POTRA domain-containing protein n=1 Tax=Histophilus somni TaxID=731 RepID=UPI00113F84E9
VLEDNRPNQEQIVEQLKSAKDVQKITKITIDFGGEEIFLDFDEVTKHYLNQPLSAKTVFALTKELTQVLYNAGYVTSAIGLKSSKIKNGEVE